MEASSETTQPQPIRFTITRQEESRNYDQPGGEEYTWTVHFRTPSGTESEVTLPGSQYTAANVHAAIQEKARVIEEIHQLGQRDAS